MTATLSPPNRRRDVAVLVPAAGRGVRLGGPVPKALRDLAGEPLLVHCCRHLAASPSVGLIVIAAPADSVDAVRQLVPEATVVTGGETRQESVAAALAAVPDGFEIILVHDAARALTPPSLVEAVAEAVRQGHDAVIPGLPVVDTIKEVSGEDQVVATVDRSRLRAVQTPQGFRRTVLTEAHAMAVDAPRASPSEARGAKERAGRGLGPSASTDDAGLVERLGLKVHTVPGHPHALKITTPWDLVVAEAILRAG